MNIIRDLRHKLDQIAKSYPTTRSVEYTIELPKNDQHGDLSTNLAMIIAAYIKQSPKTIAQQIIDLLSQIDYIEKAEIAGAGFINITLKNYIYNQIIAEIITDPFKALSIEKEGKPKKINIEYTSPNPTGPMHIGHARGAVLGSVLSRVFKKCGHIITEECYINDAGNQINLLIDSIFERYKEILGIDFQIPEGGYQGNYIKDIAQELITQFGKTLLNLSPTELHQKLRYNILNKMLEMIKKDLQKLGVTHDIFVSEREEVLEAGYIEKAIKILQEKNLVYNGILDAPRGKEPEDWEPKEQLLFRSTEFGDDIDRPIKRSNGSYTYFAGDIGYHTLKVQRDDYDIMLVALGADHAGYVSRLTAFMKAIGPQIKFQVILFQIVKLLKHGMPYRMSKRAGTFVTVEDVLQEINSDILKFMMISSKYDTTLEIDVDLVKEQSRENPVFYVQYAHTRIYSILKKASNIGIEIEEIIQTYNKLNYNYNTQERRLIKLICIFEKIILSITKTLEPLKLVNYLLDIAREFHSLWNSENYKFIDESQPEQTKARIALCYSISKVIQEILALMNITPLTEM